MMARRGEERVCEVAECICLELAGGGWSKVLELVEQPLFSEDGGS